MPNESRLEALLQSDIGILDLDVLVIGRQVMTDWGSRVDLVAIDAEGSLHVLELKRDKTPREVVAQALDYASWVRGLDNEQIRSMWSASDSRPFDQAFFDRFGANPPDSLNSSHHLVIVASELDSSTERIVNYLSEEGGIAINVLFFRYFMDGESEYLARTWLISPEQVEVRSTRSGASKTKEPWNGQDFYVSFGEDEQRSWTDAVRYGFVSGGGGRWYSRTLKQLEPGHRVFVNVPQRGYVGVGVVDGTAQRINDFEVDVEGEMRRILDAPLEAPNMARYADDPERSEYLVPVRWVKTVPVDQAVWERGMFANQNTACALRSSFTLDRLTERFALTDDD